MDLLIWNYMGAGNKKFKRNLCELVQIHKPDLLVLMETKVELASMGMFFNQMGFITSAHVDPIGRSGGILMLWNLNSIFVRVTKASSQLITTKIVTQEYPEWLLSAVYASPVSSKRKELWERLESIAQSTSEPWMVAGDFNDFASQEEKRSLAGNPHSSQDRRRTKTFADRMNRCSIMDLGCSGPKLTWTNNRKGWTNTMVRLDRAMCNSEWQTSFPEGLVRNLPRTYSNHSPLMVFTLGKFLFNPSCKLFKFGAAWISHEEFQAVVEDNWMKNHDSLLANLDNLAHKASLWNKEVFGNIFRRKRWLLGRIKDIQKSQATIYSHNLHVLEMDLVDQYNRVLYQEELFWFQKSRSKWITQDDRNTKFFHLLPLTERRKKKIDMLRGEDGVWVERFADLKLMVANYFINLFSLRSNHTLSHWNNLASHILSNEDYSELMINVTDEEVWKAVKNIKAFKAPGRDGFQAIFYHTYWKEIIHTLNSKKGKGKVEGMILKIDLKKAYDNISRAFFEQTLNEFGFDKNLIDMIMCCVTTVSTAILWNREPLEELKPEKGLRQGDPLSPYLFVLCMERLSNMISMKAAKNKWKGIQTSRGGPCLTHLFFADDLMLFRKADMRTCNTIKIILEEFCDISGLKINAPKSKVFVSSNVDRRMDRDLSAKCGIPLTSDLRKLSLLFPPNITSIILNTSPPSKNNPDSPNWKGTQCDEFLVASAYELIIGKLLTNHLRMKKGLTQLALAVMGIQSYLMMFHLFLKRAPNLFLITLKVLPPARKIKLNIDGSRIVGVGGGFGRVFRDKKLNIDSSKTVGVGGGFGRVFRDKRGNWICGYYGKMDSGTSLETELWALYKGLTVLLQQGMHGVIIEFDAQQVVQLIGEDTPDKFPFKGLLEDAKIIFKGCECTIQHVFKEGNLCADALAKLGVAQPEEMLVVKEPPFEIRSYLVVDIVGLSSERA
ncbi:uncharacterized protein LOC114323788 [Camellia sinensis]|uniref:uncharacterized protein LOC114323788 n=1 Tax=Camellia sinensis TaxID=4442 RepID=UPI001036C972|nr:uncharacterized protein LOC114323788 [Camellia sinensis]